jgi:hypothetical protein
MAGMSDEERAMLDKAHELGEALPEPFQELYLSDDQLGLFPDEQRRTMRDELRPGRGVVAATVMMIFTPLA